MNRIKELRLKHHLTQKELGKRAFVSYASLSRAERGLEKPSAVMLQSLAKYFDVPVAYIQGKAVMKCSKCGNTSVEPARYCWYCGAKLGEQSKKIKAEKASDTDLNDLIDEFEVKTGAMAVAPKRERWLKAMSSMTEAQARRLVRRVIKQMPKHHLDPVVYLDEALKKAVEEK